MKSSVQNLLKKINYIEAEVEIQKQILFSIPSGSEKDIEEVIEKIAHAKDEIFKLRKEIEAISPEEYQRIVKIEEASETFKKIAAEEKFTTVASMSTEEACSILLNNGKELPCLIKAKDEGGNWTVITLDGDIRQFGCDQVKTNA